MKMKNLLLSGVILYLLTCVPAQAYSGMYGNGGYSYRTYGSGTYGYNSAAATAARYKARYSNRNYSSTGAGTYGYTNSSSSSSFGYTPTMQSNSYYNSAKSSYSSYPLTTTTSVKSNKTTTAIKAIPFRYNTLDYTRVRNMEADPPKQYSARCTDIGDASFCR